MIHYNGGTNCETPVADKTYRNRYNGCREAAIAGELQLQAKLRIKRNAYDVVPQPRTFMKF
jgi:hypothetical protein